MGLETDAAQDLHEEVRQEKACMALSGLWAIYLRGKAEHRCLTMWLPQGRGWPLPSQGPAETDF